MKKLIRLFVTATLCALGSNVVNYAFRKEVSSAVVTKRNDYSN